MAARTNRSAVGATVRALRHAGRLDPTDAGLVRLAETFARRLDDAVAADEKAYAVGALGRVYLAVLEALCAGPPPAELEDPFETFLREVMTPGPGASDPDRQS